MRKIILTTSSAKHYGIKAAKVTIGRFSGGEVFLRANEDFDGAEAFVIGSTNAPAENTIELLFALDTSRRMKAGKITAIIPYFAYSRADKEKFSGESVSGETMAKIITAAGGDIASIISFDIHSPKIKSFFPIPFKNVKTEALFASAINSSALTVVAPDEGAEERARDFAKTIGNQKIAVLEKARFEDGSIEIKRMEGDVGNRVLMLDDIIDSGGTIIKGAEFLLRQGVDEIIVAATHTVWQAGGFLKLAESGLISKIYTTDTIAPPENLPAKVEVISIAPVLEKIIAGTQELE